MMIMYKNTISLRCVTLEITQILKLNYHILCMQPMNERPYMFHSH